MREIAHVSVLHCETYIYMLDMSEIDHVSANEYVKQNFIVVECDALQARTKQTVCIFLKISKIIINVIGEFLN